jgi:hypothetical protein
MLDLIDKIFVYDGLYTAMIVGSFLIFHSSKLAFKSNKDSNHIEQ